MCPQVLKQDSGARRALAARLHPLQLPPGMTLCEERDEAAACWVLQEGACWAVVWAVQAHRRMLSSGSNQ